LRIAAGGAESTVVGGGGEDMLTSPTDDSGDSAKAERCNRSRSRLEVLRDDADSCIRALLEKDRRKAGLSLWWTSAAVAVVVVDFEASPNGAKPDAAEAQLSKETSTQLNLLRFIV